MYDIEKVIKGLEFTKAMITFNPLTGEDIEPEDLNEDNKITYDACVGAISLLKEQEAVEPEVEVLTEIDRVYRCPKCHQFILYEKQKYCDRCGQAVKWNE